MKVLFLPVLSIMQPWYEDFRHALGDRCEIALYDAKRPFPEQVQGVNVVVEQGGSVANSEMIDMAGAAGVKFWQVIGTGLDHVDVQRILRSGMKLANTPGSFSAIALAEHALFLMLCFMKNLSQSQQRIHSGIFYEPMNHELEGKTLGLIGFGASGQALAKIALAFGMRIVAIDMVDISDVNRKTYQLAWAGGTNDLERLLQESDFVSIHVPLTSTTKHMISRRQFEVMKPTAILVNVARGAIIDEEALLDALKMGKIQGAGLDTFAQEPLSIDHAFLQMDNVIATPHVAGMTMGTSRRRGIAAADNVIRFMDGLNPLYEITVI